MPEFTWSHRKGEWDLQEHGVSFSEARTVFSDPQSITMYDEFHSEHEDWCLTIGISAKGRLLVVVHADDC